MAFRRERSCQATGHGMRDAARFLASELVEAAVVFMPAVRAEALAAPAEPKLGPGLQAVIGWAGAGSLPPTA
eukprot:5066056-Pleurochrysis_carterae.AAC.1